MNDVLQWLTILAAGAGLALYGLLMDRKEHVRPGKSVAADRGLFDEPARADEKGLRQAHAK